VLIFSLSGFVWLINLLNICTDIGMTSSIASQTTTEPCGLPSKAVGKWVDIPPVIYDMISSMITTRERLIIIERICRSFHKHSINGNGWQQNLDLLFLSSSLHTPPMPVIRSDEQLDNALQSLGLTKRLRLHNCIQYLKAYNMTSKIALSMSSWTNLHSFEWFIDPHDKNAHADSIGSLFGLMPSLQALLITPIINYPKRVIWPSISLPSLQRLEVFPPLLTRRGVSFNPHGLFQLSVGHLPKLSHLSLSRGCDFKIDVPALVDGKWHSPLIQSLQFGTSINNDVISKMISSPLLHTLHVESVSDMTLEIIAKQCPNLQHLSIYEFDDIDNRDIGIIIAKMIKLKSLAIDFAGLIPLCLKNPQSSWLQLKSLIHLQRLTIKGRKLTNLKSFPQLIELVQYLSHNPRTSKGSDDINASVSSVANGSLQQMNDMSCHEWLSINDR
jgi:hypothetical protein